MTKPEGSGGFIPVQRPLPTPAGPLRALPGRHACPRVGTAIPRAGEWGQRVLGPRHRPDREGLADLGGKICTSGSAESPKAPGCAPPGPPAPRAGPRGMWGGGCPQHLHPLRLDAHLNSFRSLRWAALGGSRGCDAGRGLISAAAHSAERREARASRPERIHTGSLPSYTTVF